MMKSIYKWFVGMIAVCAMFAATGCAQIGVTPAKSFDQQLAYGYATVTAIRNVTADAVAVRKTQVAESKTTLMPSMTAADALHVLDLTDSARSYLDLARMSKFSGDDQTAMDKLIKATSIIVAAQNFLRDNGVTK